MATKKEGLTARKEQSLGTYYLLIVCYDVIGASRVPQQNKKEAYREKYWADYSHRRQHKSLSVQEFSVQQQEQNSRAAVDHDEN